MSPRAGFGNQYQPGVNWLWATPLGIFFAITAGFHFLPQRYTPTAGFVAPCLPWVSHDGREGQVPPRGSSDTVCLY